MALKVELRPGEKIIIGESLVTNDNQRTRLFIEGDAPILREKDIITVKTANSPAKRIYLAVQMMYLSKEVGRFQDEYFSFVSDIITAAPSSIPYVTNISNLILNNNLYKALKEARSLIDYEQKLISHVQPSRADLPENPTDDRKPARVGSRAPHQGGGAAAKRR